jgi:DNA-binding PadR family transcriptional regulator
LIESYKREENGRTRCYYRLTKKGKKVLEAQREAWTRFSEAITLVLQEV